jgi:DNA-binding MarR family transcriptional regulator
MDAYAGRVLNDHFGLDYSRFVFLSPLLAGPLDVTRLAESLNFSKAAVSKRVPILEREGWVNTTEDLSAGRRVVIALSESGRARIGAAAGELNGRFGAMVAGLAIDVDTFADQVRTLTEAVHQLDSERKLQ